MKSGDYFKGVAHTWTHCSGITPSRPTIGVGPMAEETAFALTFPAPEAPVVLFHKSIPMFRLVPGMEVMGFPVTEDLAFGPPVLFCALAPENSSSITTLIAAYMSSITSIKVKSHTISQHLVEASLLICRQFLKRHGNNLTSTSLS